MNKKNISIQEDGILKMKVKLGVIGLSEGNGHPYSWSAIINGYNPRHMKDCGFPVIPEYLGNQTFPKDSISNAEVTHVWTQDYDLSKHIAKSSNIGIVVKRATEMIGSVDAILLARDDSENHLTHALPFLQAGIPIYIDKPLSCNLEDAKKLLSFQKYAGQIFTCSALKYASELQLNLEQVNRLGNISFIKAVVPKDWNKYAIHVIDPIIQFPIDKGSIIWTSASKAGCIHNLTVGYSNQLTVSIDAFGKVVCPIKINIVGDKGSIELVFSDSFSAFKAALEAFVNTVRFKNHNANTEATLESVNLIELGRLDDE